MSVVTNETSESDQISKDAELRLQEGKNLGTTSKEDEAYRVYAAVAFALVLIVVGIPLWWKTTEVYRFPLPYARIDALAHLNLHFSTDVMIMTLDPARGRKLVKDLRTIFKTSNLFQLHFTVKKVDKATLAMARSLPDLERRVAAQDTPAGTVTLLEVPGLARLTPHQVLLGLHRTVYFTTDTRSARLAEVLQLWLLREASLANTLQSMVAPTTAERNQDARRRIPPARAYDVMVSVVNPEPQKLQLDWDLPAAMRTYVEPFLRQLSPLANFTAKSQWLYLVTLEVQAKQVPAGPSLGPHFALPEDILPQIITPLEKKLGSHVSLHPCINFVLYAPPCHAAPLHIYHRQGMRLKGGADAFLSPRWGGLAIHNPSALVCTNESLPSPRRDTPDSAHVMGVFLEQLRLLVGIPQRESIPHSDVIQLTTPSVRLWELDSLLRMRALEQLTSATLTLQSLSQLLGEISNIVISSAVGARVTAAVEGVEEGTALLAGGDLLAGCGRARDAFLAAEDAFTDPSLLALLYFPDDQKYAVYIPLFLPVMIPVIMSLKNIRAWLWSGQSKVKTD